MSFWAGIKHAINSTLGTENFKPLDELLVEQIGDIITAATKKSFAASNTVYKVVNSSSVKVSAVSESPELEYIGSFSPKVSGSVRLMMNVNFWSSALEASPARIYISKGKSYVSESDGTIIEVRDVVYEIDPSDSVEISDTAVSFSYDINVSPYTYSVWVGINNVANGYYELECAQTKIGATEVTASLMS